MSALAAPAQGGVVLPRIEELRAMVAPLTGMLRLETSPPDPESWIDGEVLRDPQAEPSARLFDRFVEAGFGSTRRVAAASLLLRYGWAAGFQIGAWLDRGLALHLDAFALKFSPSTLVEAVWAKQARIAQPESREEGLAALLDSLMAFTAPLVESQHQWSGFSRHALWSMAVSSWAAQFSAIGERLGQRERAMAEAQAMFALDPVIARAAPETYTVAVGQRSRMCQVRSACCLYYKGPARHFCVSCPIITREERLRRNRDFTCVTG